MAKVFDREDAMERVEQDTELLSELMDIFVAEYKTYIVEIDTALESKDAGKLVENAHSIKSALGNVGAMSSFELAKSLEFAGRKAELDKAIIYAAQLKTEVDKYLLEVEKFKAELAA